MKVDKQSQIARIGVSAVQLLFVELGFIFREQPIEDYGIDAHIEVIDNDKATGKLIALQIKSGKSFLKEKTNDDIVFRGELKHLSYWVSHSLPVMLVIYNIEEKIAYWQIVNKDTITKTPKNWKLYIPLTQKIDNSSVNLIKQFAKKLSAHCDYTILSFRDVSHGAAKRYSANILLNKEYSKPEIVSMVKNITEELKNREYYRNHLVKQHWKGKNAQVVWLHLYLSLDDLDNTNWICQTQWIDKNLESKFAPTQIEGEDLGNGIILKWKDEYEEISTIFDSFKITKEDFLEKLDKILLPTKDIVEQLILLTEEYKRDEVEENCYINSMKKLEVTLTELYFKATDIDLAPSECADLSQQFQNVMAIAHNIVLPFSENGLKTWEKLNINRLIDSSINDYHKELSKLEFEFEKVH